MYVCGLRCDRAARIVTALRLTSSFCLLTVRCFCPTAFLCGAERYRALGVRNEARAGKLLTLWVELCAVVVKGVDIPRVVVITEKKNVLSVDDV